MKTLLIWIILFSGISAHSNELDEMFAWGEVCKSFDLPPEETSECQSRLVRCARDGCLDVVVRGLRKKQNQKLKELENE